MCKLNVMFYKSDAEARYSDNLNTKHIAVAIVSNEIDFIEAIECDGKKFEVILADFELPVAISFRLVKQGSRVVRVNPTTGNYNHVASLPLAQAWPIPLHPDRIPVYLEELRVLLAGQAVWA